MVRAGQLRHSLTIQQRSTSQDAGTGEQLHTWSTYATRRCAVERTPGKEVWAAAQPNGRVPVVFRLRYLSGVTPAMRVSFGGKLHAILSAVDQAGLEEELILTCEELAEESA